MEVHTQENLELVTSQLRAPQTLFIILSPMFDIVNVIEIINEKESLMYTWQLDQ